MSFDVDPAAYAAFMGRFSGPLAPLFADFAGVGGTGTALDVGCGTGGLTAVLVGRLGAASVSALDPSEPFVKQVRDALPGVDVRAGRAEDLPFERARFDAVLAQLVVHFMADPVAGIAEMARVARPGGVVAAAVWDHAGGRGPLAVFWAAAREVSPDTVDESGLPGVRRGHLGELFAAAGLHELTEGELSVRVQHPSFEEWWRPYTLGVGPAGAHVAALDDERRAQLRERCAELLPTGSFTTTAVAWAVRGRA